MKIVIEVASEGERASVCEDRLFVSCAHLIYLAFVSLLLNTFPASSSIFRPLVPVTTTSLTPNLAPAHPVAFSRIPSRHRDEH